MRRVDHDREVDDGVDAQLADELADHGEARVGVHEVHLFERAHGVGDVAAEELRHLRREPARDLGAERVGDAGDEDATRSVGGHGLPQSK